MIYLHYCKVQEQVKLISKIVLQGRQEELGRNQKTLKGASEIPVTLCFLILVLASWCVHFCDNPSSSTTTVLCIISVYRWIDSKKLKKNKIKIRRKINVTKQNVKQYSRENSFKYMTPKQLEYVPISSPQYLLI